jgi:hypothetical protein
MIKGVLVAGAVGLLALGLSGGANAAVNRIWVSGKGADVAGCATPANPCRTFQYAHDTIAEGGEIDVLDPGGYGPVIINKSLSIVNDGVGTAGVQQTTAGVYGVFIDALGSASVYLRGLNIDGLGVGAQGIRVSGVGKLAIVNCVVRHFVDDGIHISPDVGTLKFTISNTISSDNGNSGIAVVARGLSTVAGVIGQTTVANNAFNGVYTENIASVVNVTIVDSTAFNNINGFVAIGSTLRLSRSVATANNFGVFNGAGSVESFSDNNFHGNQSGANTGSVSKFVGD